MGGGGGRSGGVAAKRDIGTGAREETVQGKKRRDVDRTERCFLKM